VGSEEQLFREVDLVFVTSEQLRVRAAAFSQHVHLFPFGVSFAKFERVRQSETPPPADLAGLRRPIVGYVGGVHRWIDFELLAETAKLMPEVSFAVVGPVQTDVSALDGLPNVHLLGKKEHDQVPAYIKGFDVGIVPYRLADYTANVYPTKLNEYLAMGLPVVASDLPEIRRFNHDHGAVVRIASGADAFARELRAALVPSPPEVRTARISVARENSWQTRIENMSMLVHACVEESRARRRPWEERLRRLYRRTRGRTAAAVVALGVLPLALLYTNLAWHAADAMLRVSTPPRPADAIVVFAGGVGESGQAGGGYQERVKQAVDLYQARMAERMVFQSGFVFAFREAEIMRGLALSLGVPPEAIVLETTGANTYEAVVRVRDLLREKGWRRVLLVSSPYNMRRATLVWRRQASDIEVIPTPVAETQFYTHYRGASVGQLRGLAQEAAALAWYWWKGWL
jgi:uncharacterized SAM-binding protein YcdF (DUF218 family)